MATKIPFCPPKFKKVPQKIAEGKMAQAARLSVRMQKELKLLLTDPPPGVSFPFLSPDSDVCSLSTIDAQIEGPEGTVYSPGIFHVKIQIPERYPFQPPNVTFVTPIYHPNIDNGGRICLDILNLPPKGAWQPSLNISTVMTSIGLLLSEPNPDDGLMCEMSREYKYNRCIFDQKARAMIEKYAKPGALGNSCKNQSVQIQTTADISISVDGEQSDKESIHVEFPIHSRPRGISRKLSLAPSRSTNNEGSDKETNAQLDSTSMEAKIDKEKLCPNNLSCENLCGESSIQFHKRVDHNMKDQESNGVSLPISSKELTFDSKILGSNNPFEASQQIPRESSDLCQTGDGNNEKTLKPPFPVRKKLSLGFRGLAEGHRKEEKENILVTNKLLHSNPGNQTRTEIMRKQPVNQDQSGILTEKIQQRREEIPVSESVIVLDSEDSEEEEDVAVRTKLSIVTKRLGKRKARV